VSLSDVLHKIIDIRTEQDRQEAHQAVDDADAAPEAPPEATPAPSADPTAPETVA
jgi:hypothetical protein